MTRTSKIYLLLFAISAIALSSGAASIHHKFVNPHADGPDATVVRPSNWNDDHDLVLGADENLMTADEKAILSRTSGTNTGDNAANSQYSGLAASKEDTGVAAGLDATHAALTTGVHGAGANLFVYSNDSRLTDARTPTTHDNTKHSVAYTTAGDVSTQITSSLASPGPIGQIDPNIASFTSVSFPEISRPITITGDGYDALIVNNGHIIAPYADTIRMAPYVMSGGGNIKWGVTASNTFSWDASIYLSGLGLGDQSSALGLFTIDIPTAGTAVNVINAGARNWSANGVTLLSAETLYYEIPHGGDGSSVPENFWIVGASDYNNAVVGHDWVMIASRPYSFSTSAVRTGIGSILSYGQTWVGNDGFAGQLDLATKLTTSDVFSDFIVNGLLFTSGASRTNNVMSAGSAYAFGSKVVKATLTKTFNASRDYYIDLSNIGVFAYPNVANGAAAPNLSANSLRLEKVVTDANNVTSVTVLAPVRSFTVDSYGRVNISSRSSGTGILSSGTATISTAATSTNSLVFVSSTGGGANIGSLYESLAFRVIGTSFTVKSTNAADTSGFNWWIINQ